MKNLRLLLSGLNDGPPVGQMLELLGKEMSLQRIQERCDMINDKK